jgi:hypothetical protein
MPLFRLPDVQRDIRKSSERRGQFRHPATHQCGAPRPDLCIRYIKLASALITTSADREVMMASVVGQKYPKRLRLPAGNNTHDHMGRIVPLPEVAALGHQLPSQAHI